ncbi:MAG TPA: ribonuclease HII [Bryobacteraceae bacterium]|nr:ribonuclease HII [Bryobacteraceae bacterium]
MPSSRFERAARQAGFRVIAGLDEAGRGALFGPVFAGAVVLDPARQIRGLDDSKALPPDRRAVLAVRIRERALAWGVGAADVYEIDRVNIYQASRLAMSRALEKVNGQLRAKSLAPCDYLLLDAMKLDVAIEQKSLIHGDARSFSIAAASILAKVHRDQVLCQWDRVFPEYCLASNKGYGTPEHYSALDCLGPTALHRFSFEPVRLATPLAHWTGYPLLKPVPEQSELFPCP